MLSPSLSLKTLKWRETWDIASLSSWDPPLEVSQGYDTYLSGYDKEGRPGQSEVKPQTKSSMNLLITCITIIPVYYAPLGRWTSSRDLFEAGKEEDCLKYAAKLLEFVYREHLLKSKYQNFICIVDIDGENLFRKALYEMQNLKGLQDLIWLFKDYEANYPETLHKAFIINGKQFIREPSENGNYEL